VEHNTLFTPTANSAFQPGWIAVKIHTSISVSSTFRSGRWSYFSKVILLLELLAATESVKLLLVGRPMHLGMRDKSISLPRSSANSQGADLGALFGRTC